MRGTEKHMVFYLSSDRFPVLSLPGQLDRFSMPTHLQQFFGSLEGQMVRWLTEMTNTGTPSDQKQVLDQLAEQFARRFDECGAQSEIVEIPAAGNHLLARWSASSGPSQKQVLILGHLDTVWEMGECQRRPAKIENGKLFGPGALDMRGGLTLVLALARYLADVPSGLTRPITVLLNSDEEVGSRTSRALIESEAGKSQLALVVEPCLPGGALKTSRKGVGHFRIAVEGIAAHAGVDFAKGVSAIRELASQIQDLYELNDPANGTTVNVGVIKGGFRSNVVADYAEMEVDVRIGSDGDGERVASQIRQLRPRNKDAKLRISGGINRPPLERTETIVAAFQRAKTLASEIGIKLEEGATGGGSDGCFTAALGVPTLDGLGPDGAGPHALHEHVLIESLVPRAALLTKLALEL